MLELESAEIISKLLLRPWLLTKAPHHTQLLATCWLVSTGVRGLDCGYRTELLLLLLLLVVKMVVMVTAGWCVVRRLAAW